MSDCMGAAVLQIFALRTTLRFSLHRLSSLISSFACKQRFVLLSDASIPC